MACPAIARPQPHKLTGTNRGFGRSLQHSQATALDHLPPTSLSVEDTTIVTFESDGAKPSIMPSCSTPSFDPLIPNGWFLEQPDAHIQLMTVAIEHSESSDISSSSTPNVKIAKRARPSRGYLAQFPKRKSARLASQHASPSSSTEDQDEYFPAPEPRVKFSPSHHFSVPGRSLLKQSSEQNVLTAPASSSSAFSSEAHYNGIYSMENLEKFIENRDMMQLPVYRYQLRKSAKKCLRWSDTLEW